MNYFEVYEIKASKLTARQVNSDGTPSDYSETWAGEDEVIEYIVYEYEEDGTPINTLHYHVGGFYPDAEDAFEQIKEDHQPDEWQNHNW